MTTPAEKVDSVREVLSIQADALNAYSTAFTTAATGLLAHADTTQNREIVLMKALKECADAYRFFGFAQLVRMFAEVDGKIAPVEVVEMESKTDKDARMSALTFIKALREEGFDSVDINDFTGEIKQVTEAARLLGQAECLVHMES